MIRQIVVGVDFSPESRRALRHGCECADRFQVPLRVLHVLPSPVPAGGETPLPPDPRRIEAEERGARIRLEAWVEGMPRAKAEVLRGCGEATRLTRQPVWRDGRRLNRGAGLGTDERGDGLRAVWRESVDFWQFLAAVCAQFGVVLGRPYQSDSGGSVSSR